IARGPRGPSGRRDGRSARYRCRRGRVPGYGSSHLSALRDCWLFRADCRFRRRVILRRGVAAHAFCYVAIRVCSGVALRVCSSVAVDLRGQSCLLLPRNLRRTPVLVGGGLFTAVAVVVIV